MRTPYGDERDSALSGLMLPRRLGLKTDKSLTDDKVHRMRRSHYIFLDSLNRIGHLT